MDYINSKATGITCINSVIQDVEQLKVTKQDLLVSGSNIKTINNNSLLGAGNITITPAVLSQALTANVTVGGVTSGTTFPVGTSLEDILRAILCLSTNKEDNT